jgi:hypothetical protein
MKIQYIGNLHSITLEDKWVFYQHDIIDIPDSLANHLIARPDFQVISEKEIKKKRGEKK